MNEDDIVYRCKICNYNTTRRGNMKTHKSSKKHLKNVEKIGTTLKYECKLCNYKTDCLAHYNQHLETRKHKNIEKENKTKDGLSDGSMVESEYDSFEEDCEEDNITDEEDKITNKEIKEGFCMMQEMFCELIKSNQQLATIVQNGTNHITNISNNNNNNNTNNFNLQFFLNETCKDAINMTDFIESLDVSIADLKKLGNKGYVEGISSLMINKLNELDVTKRPIHSTDVKRNSIYIKDDDEWEKDEKEKLMSILWDVARKETQALEAKYKLEFPKCETDRNSREHEEYWRIFYNAMGGKGGNIDDLQKKVIRRIVQHVAIDKTINY